MADDNWVDKAKKFAGKITVAPTGPIRDRITPQGSADKTAKSKKK